MRFLTFSPSRGVIGSLLGLLLGMSPHSLFADEPFPIPSKSKVVDSAYEEVTKPRRRAVRQVWYLGIGPAFFGNLNVSGAGYLVSGSYGWDLNEAIIKMSAETAFNSGAFWANIGLGVQGFLLDTDHAPYIAGDFGIAYSHLAGPTPTPSTATGFSLGAQIGYQFFRRSSVQFDVGVKYVTVLKDNPLGRPYAFLIKFGIWF